MVSSLSLRAASLASLERENEERGRRENEEKWRDEKERGREKGGTKKKEKEEDRDKRRWCLSLTVCLIIKASILQRICGLDRQTCQHSLSLLCSLLKNESHTVSMSEFLSVSRSL